MSPASAASFDNVQIFAQTPTNQAHDFQFAAYNITGSLIASTQTSYPAAAFELPAGGYLFTIGATAPYNQAGYACPLSDGSGVVGNATSGAEPTAQANNSSPTVTPPACYPPSSEYGYVIASISGPQSINVHMENASSLPTAPVTIRVTYVNGTAAAGAPVYASVVGELDYWWGPNSTVSLSGQTDSNGTVRLVLPVAPVVITAWEWVPITTGSNGSTVQTNIGGQKVNATIYWQPTYIGLSGTGLLLPPQNTLNVTLYYQQPDYWVLPANVVSRGTYPGSASTGTEANQPSGVPSLASSNSEAEDSGQYYLPTQIPAIQQTADLGSPSGAPQGISAGILAAAALAFVVVAIAVVFLAVRRNLHRPPLR